MGAITRYRRSICFEPQDAGQCLEQLSKVNLVRVNILLPDVVTDPVGGFKVAYEYANRLCDLGYDVVIYHSRNFDLISWHFRAIAALILWNIRGRNKITWFMLNQPIRCRYVPRLKPAFLRRTNVTILTSYQTAEVIPSGARRAGVLLQIVYDFEIWAVGSPDSRSRIAHALHRSDVGHIATSSAVERMLEEIGIHPIATITCGIDIPEPSLIPPTESRPPIISFPLRREPFKGALDVLEALPLIRHQYPSIIFECFGNYEDGQARSEGLAVHRYLDDQELLDLYRRSLIFILPSHAEGWGLPAAEAMANGAAVVVTENGGSADFAIHGETALVVPPRDAVAIAQAVSLLLRDEPLRQKLVSGGITRSQTMSWDRAISQLVRVIRDSSQRSVPIGRSKVHRARGPSGTQT